MAVREVRDDQGGGGILMVGCRLAFFKFKKKVFG